MPQSTGVAAFRLLRDWLEPLVELPQLTGHPIEHFSDLGPTHPRPFRDLLKCLSSPCSRTTEAGRGASLAQPLGHRGYALKPAL